MSRELSLEKVTCPLSFSEEGLSAILHSILVIRLSKKVTTEDVYCKRISPFIYSKCKEVGNIVVSTVSRITEECRSRRKNYKTFIRINFFSKASKSMFDIFGKDTKDVYESWIIPVEVVYDESNKMLSQAGSLSSRAGISNNGASESSRSRSVSFEDTEKINEFIGMISSRIFDIINRANDISSLPAKEYEFEII